MCCPSCGSSDLNTSEQGFSGLKAAAGVFTIGAVGALLGTHGSHNLHFACKKCGRTFSFDEAKKVYSAAIVNGVQENLEDKIKSIIYRKGIAEATRYYKDKTGVGFTEAANYVKNLDLKMQEAKIDQNANLTTFEKEKKKLELEQQSSGCASVLLIFIVVSLLITLI